MRLASYILAALAIGFMLDVIAPAMGSSSTNRWPSVEVSKAANQVVNRDAKADRLPASGRSSLEKTVREIPHTPATRPVPEGCDPAFSPLSVSAKLNYASRCMADASQGLRKPV